MDRTEYRRQSLGTWNDLAQAWDERRDEIGEPVTAVRDWLVDRLAPREGETILDIACGTGELTEVASSLVGDSGRVISTDFADAMVSASRRRGERLGLSNVDYRQMDAEQMDLEDGSVDGAMCRFGYMLMADRDAALRETRRVLRDGGRVAFAVWAEPVRNPWLLVPGSVLIERGHLPPPDPDAPGVFALGDRGKIEASLANAGLVPVEIDDVEIEHDIPDEEALWSQVTGVMGPLAAAISRQSADEQESIRAAVKERAEHFLGDDGYRLPGAAFVALAQPAA